MNGCISPNAADMASIYQDHINLAVWQNAMQQCLGKDNCQQLLAELPALLSQPGGFRFQLQANREDMQALLDARFPQETAPEQALKYYLGTCIELFSTLFEPEAMALRLVTLTTAMCPRFHSDQVPARLVSTLYGPPTEWLPENAVDRSALGAGGMDPCNNHHAIQQLQCGDLALLKGEGWLGNEGRSLVHRSPAVKTSRLFLSVDFATA
jgi:hypothetical protein